MKTRIFATVAVVAILTVGVSAPALASQSYTGALSANSAAPGGSVQYTSDDTGEPDGTPGSYSLAGNQSGALGGPTSIELTSSVTHAVQVGAHSQLSFKVTLPTSAKPGSVFTLSVKAGKFADEQSIKIVGVPASATSASLAPLWIALVAVILIALVVIFFIMRRRRTVQ